MRKKILKIAAIPLILVPIALFGIWLVHWRYFETTDDAYVQADNVVIIPKVAGYVTAVDVTENQLVHKGDTIVQLENDDYIARRDQAQAEVNSTESQVVLLDRQKALQTAMIAQATAGISAAKAKANDADIEYERDKHLIAQGYVTKERMDADQAAAAAADANTVQAEAALRAAESQLAVIEAQQQQTQAGLAQAKARLANAQIDLDHTVIKAPLDGSVGNRSAQVGDYVGPGSQLFTFVPESDLYVIANFKETEVERMHVGQHVSLWADVNPGRELYGVIQSLSPATGSEYSLLPPQNATGNFTKIVQRLPVRIEFTRDSDPPADIRAGLSMVVTVDTRH